MQDTTIQCHNCGTTIAVSDVLRGQLRQELDAEQQQAIHNAAERARQQAQADLQQQLQIMQQQVSDQQSQAAQEITLLQSQLSSSRQKVEAAQQAELALRQQKAELEDRARDMELEIQRRLDTERHRVEAILRQQIGEEQNLKLKEKEKQIDDLRKSLEDAKRRSELGSQELQGEVLEQDMQASLQQRFPHDRIQPVPKGMRGADIIQTIINTQLQECGTIIWESKNTKAWSPAWIDKLKEDQRHTGAAIAVLVSAVLPEHIRGFGRVDSVWVADLKSWVALAAVLREQLVQVHFARAASQGLDAKMELLYRYLSGDEFRQQVESIIEAFDTMQGQIQKERRAMEKHWAEREKHLQRVMIGTSGMYGALRGLIGQAMPTVAALEMDDGFSLEHQP
ncbi:MAG: DUF2130 domain-containing protein [Thiothrix sp.]|uniref:DUF2130 domain-containing protein n=1 Tax=Thiothrix sp. TaxID=1032 RepID=UPI002634C25A|nr:DUF2130 domain-containing protein [Thiothrix sp.]MDD5394054.1 DUF2130 domain-containing protein [Thiothrix sp.]